MTKERAFIEVDRQDVRYRPVEERVRDYRWVELPFSEKDIQAQASRCMGCGIPFCHAANSGCSLANLIPEFNEHVYYGRWKEALDILTHTHCFPEFTGRVCPAPCESACVLGIIRPPVNICKIELAIIEEGFHRDYIQPEPPSERYPESVAVVGSGPAGLAAAYVLNRRGFRVVVFEKAPKPGGLLRYGIPDFKLEKWVVDRRLSLMKKEGVIFECGVDVGKDVSTRFVTNRFHAVVLATGAQQPRDLLVPGRDLKGIHFAMEYLTQQNLVNDGVSIGEDSRISAAGKHVVVIGGGDTGADCIGTAWRQGAVSVTQLEILPEPPPTRSPTTPWPLWPLMRRESSSHKEGPTNRLWSVQTEEFLGENGRVKQVRCVRVEWRQEKGVWKPTPVPGSEFVLTADLVLLAMGFVGPGHTALVEDLDLARDERGFLCRDSQHMTNVPGIFVAGDMHRGASLVVHAISDGMRTAGHVARYLHRIRGGVANLPRRG